MNEFFKLEKICYSRNFLKEVIVRIDFVSPIESIASKLPKEVNIICLKYFPIAEPKPAITRSVELGPRYVATEKREFTEWNFYGRNREKKLTITPQWLFITYKKYNKYEYLKEDFLTFINKFFQTFKEAQPSRFGLRYINSIHVEKENPLDWTNYINKNLLCLFNLSFENAKPIRIFHNLEFTFSNFNLRFQFGMHNPDYPSQIKKNIFILDYDAYYKGLIDPADISNYLEQYHLEIQKLFEYSITDNMRELLNERKR